MLWIVSLYAVYLSYQYCPNLKECVTPLDTEDRCEIFKNFIGGVFVFLCICLCRSICLQDMPVQFIRLFFLIADISLVSNTCPYTIKLLACQLLLEITSFLRDNYLDYLCEKDVPSSSSPRGSSDYVRKLSSSSTSRINKTLLLKVPLAPAIAVQDESGSSTSGLRKYSGYSRFGMSLV